MGPRVALEMSSRAPVLGTPRTQAQPKKVHQGRANAFEISLAAWSFHRALRTRFFALEDLGIIAREQFGIDAIELVNTMFAAPTDRYLTRMRQRCEDHGVRVLLIMCDEEGELAHPLEKFRKRAVRNHHKWIDSAEALGASAIRVNLYGEDLGVEESDAVIESFVDRGFESISELIEYGARRNVEILVENHGGLSSNPEVLARLATRLNSSRFGTLPDFGNFPTSTNRYAAVARLMPWAHAVSAKCYDFDADGHETTIDFERMLRIVVEEHQYDGYVGIEFEGHRLTEFEGVHACKRLLEKCRDGIHARRAQE
ncbi:MAG: TIM barrel protein [Planctomycetes bacterium]|nr:TIM barrel protein [Planctomycetota bacterium]